ncbi:hypothetical protein PAAG_08272 [Paracoccidioides lutzii Pb01]|uniref:Fungal-type protein kinase domain-containing protein n=1 Tax=Paracoccidioides lutzii (strain ATCC MYA-826 / Pb01) TaxID=502779 RepID=C1HBY1_PARBA|nr:hypothetical protein PAAG_08272 [Paracoccidioides lutzii Pb01]EEH38545.2 hypothetical protein PAAG_08272 [Paracoccidioides lutzii Pb01]
MFNEGPGQPKLLRSKNQKTGRRTEVPPLNRGSPSFENRQFSLWKPLFKPDEVADEQELPAWFYRLHALTIKEDRDVTPEDFVEDLSSLSGLSFDSEANCGGAGLGRDKRVKAALLDRNDLLIVDTALPPPPMRRRVVAQEYGKPIYCSSSRAALLAGLHTDNNNPSWRAFLIDLDLAIKKRRDESLGAQGKTGTRAFMAIGVLYGGKHSFMHDMESFFSVLFWICIHYYGPNKGKEAEHLEKWNYMETEELAQAKKGLLMMRKAVATPIANFSDNAQDLWPPDLPLDAPLIPKNRVDSPEKRTPRFHLI